MVIQGLINPSATLACIHRERSLNPSVPVTVHYHSIGIYFHAIYSAFFKVITTRLFTYCIIFLHMLFFYHHFPYFNFYLLLYLILNGICYIHLLKHIFFIIKWLVEYLNLKEQTKSAYKKMGFRRKKPLEEQRPSRRPHHPEISIFKLSRPIHEKGRGVCGHGIGGKGIADGGPQDDTRREWWASGFQLNTSLASG